MFFARAQPVPPENAIHAQTRRRAVILRGDTPLPTGCACEAWGVLARKPADWTRLRALRLWMADTNEGLQELMPRGGSDDANRRPAESRLPFLRMDARLDVEWYLYSAESESSVFM